MNAQQQTSRKISFVYRIFVPIALAIAVLGIVVYLNIDLPTEMEAKRAFRDVKETLDTDILTTNGEVRDLLQLRPNYVGAYGDFPFSEHYVFEGVRKKYTRYVYYRVLDNSITQLADVQLESKKRS